MKKAYLLSIIFICCISCADDANYVPVPQAAAVIDLPDTPYNYVNLNLPQHFFTNDGSDIPSSINGIDNNPTDNPVTDAGATLGRVLFYDIKLSQNNTIACGSCHRQNLAFTDSPVHSLGFLQVPTRRHSISLVNQRYYFRGHFFWDERANTLEDQVLMPMLDVNEMGLTANEITQRVSARPFYGPLFQAAFGTGTISNERIADALSQFIRSIVSSQSKYDTGRAQVANRQTAFPNFTAEENQGKNLFMKPVNQGGAGCFQCHATEAFVSVNSGPKNNGLDLTSTIDFGAFETFPTNIDFKGAFKIPTLKNIALTAPYMHDGRFSTLQQVIEHYNSGVKNHPNLSPQLKDSSGNPQQLNLTEAQKAALLAFLRTLTDENILNNIKWSDPYINQHL
ncbi:MAG: cytochrome c peroxidase [Flavobacterium sp.]|uniref:cytochrome-c peroxidase n=1 Tax=Flavobacterium sp. TaxID=239 RepID=UPI003263DE8B